MEIRKERVLVICFFRLAHKTNQKVRKSDQRMLQNKTALRRTTRLGQVGRSSLLFFKFPLS